MQYPLIIESIVKDIDSIATSESSDAITRWRARVLMIKGFADIVIADIIAEHTNHYSAEIAPRTVYPLYGMYLASLPLNYLQTLNLMAMTLICHRFSLSILMQHTLCN